MTKNLIYAAKSAGDRYRTPLGPDVLTIQLSNNPNTDILKIYTTVSSRALFVDHAILQKSSRLKNPIDSVKVFVNVHPDDADHRFDGVDLNASDGELDKIYETATVILNTSQWEKQKRHTLYLQASDAQGYSGPV